MPGCVHGHKHNRWPSAGPLLICPGERTCGYCEGKDAKVDHGAAVNLRKHAYYEHTDGGKMDYGGVEVMMYRPTANRRKETIDAYHISQEDVVGEERPYHGELEGRTGPGDGSAPREDEVTVENAQAKSLELDSEVDIGVRDPAGSGEKTKKSGGENRNRWKSQAGKKSGAEKARQTRMRLKLNGAGGPEPINASTALQALQASQLPNSGLMIQRSL